MWIRISSSLRNSDLRSFEGQNLSHGRILVQVNRKKYFQTCFAEILRPIGLGGMSFGEFSIHLCMLDYISKSIFYSKRTCAYQMAESMQTRPHFPENGDQIYQTYI